MMDFLVMDAAAAQALRDATAESSARLDPRQIDLGEFAGQSLLPARVLADLAFADLRDALAALPAVALDPATLWSVEQI